MFRNARELLVYLIALEDSEDDHERDFLRSGQALSERLIADGIFDRSSPDRDFAELGRLLWRLKQADSITFIDTHGPSRVGGRLDPALSSLTRDDVSNFANIEVLMHGRIAAKAEASASNTINIGGDVRGSAIQQGTVGSTQTVTTTSGIDVQAAVAALAELRAALLTTGIEAPELEADLATIDVQLASPGPKTGILRESIASVRRIAEGIVAGGAAPEVLHYAEQLSHALGF
jgi:hypothetical protein